jgi:H/ACA ribonucleoprotein complex subunit 3
MKMLFCKKCREYTLKERCPICNGKTAQNKPPKFSPEDKYGEYRRRTKNDDGKERKEAKA